MENVSISVNKEVTQFAYQPKVITYNNNLSQIVSDFITECQQHGIIVDQESTAVISRSKSIRNEVSEIPEIDFRAKVWVDNYTREFAFGKFLYDNNQFKEGFKIMEKVLLRNYI